MHLFIIPLLMMVATQAIKLALEAYKGNFTWAHVNSYGGMPSSHAAIVASLSYTLGYFQGLDSPSFAISLILFVIIIRDAMGFRYQLGIHGQILNKLIKELPDRKEYRFPVLSERLGHTLAEVTVGIIIGIAGTALVIALAF